jgi:hypothetical protein
VKAVTTEWLEAMKEKSNTDAEYLKKMKRFSLTLQILTTDCSGVDKLTDLTFDKGKITEFKLEEKAMPSDWRSMPCDLSKYFARLVATYNEYVKVLTGEVTPMAAISTGALTIVGDQMKVMGKLGEIGAFVDLLKTIPVEY